MTRRKDESSRDPVKIDIQVRVEAGSDATKTAQERAIRQWVETGHAPRGYTISAVHWSNPARKDPAKRGWRKATNQSDIEQARSTLRRFLLSSRFQPRAGPPD